MDHRQDAIARSGVARQHDLYSDRDAGYRAWRQLDLGLFDFADPNLWNHLGFAARVSHEVHALRHSRRFGVDDSNQQRARGSVAHCWRHLVSDVPQSRAALVDAGVYCRLDLHQYHRLERALDFDFALFLQQYGAVDHGIRSLGRRPVHLCMRPRSFDGAVVDCDGVYRAKARGENRYSGIVVLKIQVWTFTP